MGFLLYRRNKKTSISIDFNLGYGLRGEVYSKELLELGFPAI